ncbi:hypothetical protein NKH18_48030 [Streptomyces sp. M10(2022)]
MIIRVNPRDLSPNEPLAEALGRPVSGQEGLTDHTVVAHWPGLDYYTPSTNSRSGRPSSGPSTWTTPPGSTLHRQPAR